MQHKQLKCSFARIIALYMMFMLCFSPVTMAGDDEDYASKDLDVSFVTAHKFTGAKVTPVPSHLKKADTRGGEIIQITDGFDFSKPNIEYGTNRDVAHLQYVDLGNGNGCYKYTIDKHNLGSQSTYSKKFAPIKPNRNYLVSVLLWSDFSRINSSGATCEGIIDIGIVDKDQKGGVNLRRGIPDYTGGWTRFEYIASPGLMETAVNARFVFQTWSFNLGMPEGNIYIADFTVVELPEVTDTPAYKEGEGVTFRGSAGNLDMKVENAEETEQNITVTTTGTQYKLDKINSTITASQRIGMKRKVSTWQSNISFATLKIRSTTEKKCVISNSEITFGVQMDGMVFLTPHKGDVKLTCTSEIAGMWNKFAFGFLTVVDDYGGFTVTPDLPEGTGKLCAYDIITENLDFTSETFSNYLGLENNQEIPYLNHISNAKPGWQIAWTISPGERLAIATFPPREYDWEESFEMTYRNMDWNSVLNSYANDYQNFYIRVINMFSISDKGYAMEWGRHYTQNVYGKEFREHIKAAREAGMKVITYAPAYFYYNKESPDEYITEITRLKNLYGIDGIYSDGLPSEHQWITAYEESRMLRELFPDGVLIVHNTGNAANGGPPLSAAAHFIPNIDTYWTATLKGESVGAVGFHSAVASITWPQHNLANSIGIPKGDGWKYVNEKGEVVKLPQGMQDLIFLEYNGRARITLYDDEFKTGYVTVLRKLKQLWQEHGNDPDFYDKYYAPEVRALTRDKLSKYGDIQELNVNFSEENVLAGFGIYHTDAETQKSGEEVSLKLKGKPIQKQGSVLKRINSVAGPMSIEYRFKIQERGNFEHSFSDNYDNTAIGLAFGEDGKIKIKNISGNYVNIGTYKRNQWYSIQFEIDTDKHSYTIYMDGKKIKEGMKLDSKVYQISELEFSDGGYGSVCFLDDIKVLNKYY